MENEIEKLKKTYLDTKAPADMELYGFDDVKERLLRKDIPSYKTYRILGFAAFVSIFLIGFTSATFASKPNSTLYSLKIAAQKAITDMSHATPKKVENALEHFIMPQTVTPTVTPTIPTTTPTPTVSQIKRIESGNHEQSDKKEDGESTNSNREKEVEGVSTINTSQQSQTQEESQSHNNSENHISNQNNSNPSSQSKENSSKHKKD